MLSAQLVSLKVVTASGKLMKVNDTQRHLLNAFRLSYGMLGIIYEVTLRVRPIMNFAASHRSMDVDAFANISDRLATLMSSKPMPGEWTFFARSGDNLTLKIGCLTHIWRDTLSKSEARNIRSF